MDKFNIYRFVRLLDYLLFFLYNRENSFLTSVFCGFHFRHMHKPGHYEGGPHLGARFLLVADGENGR